MEKSLGFAQDEKISNDENGWFDMIKWRYGWRWRQKENINKNRLRIFLGK